MDYAGKSAYNGTVATTYDEARVGEMIWVQEQAFIEQWARSLTPGKTILDLPAGTGRFLEFFLQRGLRVLARDISADMLAEIRRLHPAVAAADLDIREGDAEHLELADQSVDYLISWRLLHLVPFPMIPAILREFHRVARGPVVVQVFAVDAGNREAPWRKKIKDALRPLWRRLRPAPPAPAATPWSHIPSHSHAEAALLAAFSQAGFMVDRTHTFDPGSRFPNRVYFLSRRPCAGEDGGA